MNTKRIVRIIFCLSILSGLFGSVYAMNPAQAPSSKQTQNPQAAQAKSKYFFSSEDKTVWALVDLERQYIDCNKCLSYTIPNCPKKEQVAGVQICFLQKNARILVFILLKDKKNNAPRPKGRGASTSSGGTIKTKDLAHALLKRPVLPAGQSLGKDWSKGEGAPVPSSKLSINFKNMGYCAQRNKIVVV